MNFKYIQYKYNYYFLTVNFIYTLIISIVFTSSKSKTIYVVKYSRKKC